MGIQAGEKDDSVRRFKLPKVLSYYNKSDYTTQQKARFIYHLCIAAMVGMVFIIFSSTYVQLKSIEYDGIFLPVILSEIALLIFFGICLFLLTKGKYGISAHLFMTIAMACVWYVMWIHRGNIITRLDTVVFIIALLNLTPLFITKYKIAIPFYIVVNVIILIVFVQIIKDRINLSDASAVDYIVDTSIAILFTGIVGYNIFRINKESLEKVESDNKERKKAEEALKQSELFRRTVFDSSTIPIIVMESISFKYIDINEAAVKIYGFSSHEASLGKTPLDVSAPVQYDGTPSSQKAVSYIEKALKEGSVTFEWLHQRPDGEFWDAEVHLLSFRSDEKTLLQFSLIDITERKKIESDLKESELRYRTLFENAQIGIYQTTPGGDILQANPAIIKMTGFNSLSELNKRNLETENNFLKSTRNFFIEIIEKQGFVKDFESEWKKKNGETIILIENARAVRDTEGKTLYYEGFVENITERKLAEKALKESEEKYRTLMENMNDIVMMVDNDDRVLYVNKKFSEKLGYSDNEIIGEIGYKKLLVSEDQEVIIKANKERTKNVISQYETTFIAKDGSKIDFFISGAPVRDPEGKIIGSIGNMIDITERKQAEKALKESQQLFQALAQVSPVGIFRTKADGYTTYVNPKWMELSGLTFEEAIGDGWLIAVHPEDKEMLRGNWKSHSGKSENSTAEYRFIKPDGSIVWVLGNAEPEIIDNKIMGYIGTITDITEKKIIEKELEKHRNHLEFLVKDRTEELATSNEELLSTNEELHKQREELEVVLKNLQNTQKQLVQAEKMASLGVLASGVAHEINNPLNFIKGGIFGLEQYFDENLKEHKEEVSPLIEGIHTGVERAANIVTSLNHYSRRDDSKLVECDIHSIIDNCLVILRNQIINRIDIKKNYSPKLHSLYGNEGKLHQAMLNVLSNAVQAIDNKGVINVKTTASKHKITIFVSDTGCGISTENMPKIFDPFFTTKEAGKGTGLGLSITHNILEEHNGTIEVESSLGNGSSVKITLPLNKI